MKFTFAPALGVEKTNIIKQYNLLKMNNVRVKLKYAQNQYPLLNNSARSVTNCMKRDGFKCKCCGADNVFYIIREDGKRLVPSIEKNGCVVRLTRDHNLLKSLNGSNADENMNALCYDCNTLRSNDFAEYQEFKEYYDSLKDSSYVEPEIPNFCYINYSLNFNNRNNLTLIAMDEVPGAVKLEIRNRLKSQRKTVVSNIKFSDMIHNTNIFKYVPVLKLLEFIVKETLELKFHIFTDVSITEFNSTQTDIQKYIADFIADYRRHVRWYINLDNEEKLKRNDLNSEVKKIILTSAKEVLQCTKTH